MCGPIEGDKGVCRSDGGSLLSFEVSLVVGCMEAPLPPQEVNFQDSSYFEAFRSGACSSELHAHLHVKISMNLANPPFFWFGSSSSWSIYSPFALC